MDRLISSGNRLNRVGSRAFPTGTRPPAEHKQKNLEVNQHVKLGGDESVSQKSKLR